MRSCLDWIIKATPQVDMKDSSLLSTAKHIKVVNSSMCEEAANRLK